MRTARGLSIGRETRSNSLWALQPPQMRQRRLQPARSRDPGIGGPPKAAATICPVTSPLLPSPAAAAAAAAASCAAPPLHLQQQSMPQQQRQIAGKLRPPRIPAKAIGSAHTSAGLLLPLSPPRLLLRLLLPLLNPSRPAAAAAAAALAAAAAAVAAAAAAAVAAAAAALSATPADGICRPAVPTAVQQTGSNNKSYVLNRKP